MTSEGTDVSTPADSMPATSDAALEVDEFTADIADQIESFLIALGAVARGDFPEKVPRLQVGKLYVQIDAVGYDLGKDAAQEAFVDGLSQGLILGAAVVGFAAVVAFKFLPAHAASARHAHVDAVVEGAGELAPVAGS